jgi:C1A family cysteine protease
MLKNARYGWRPDLPDIRDYKYEVGITGNKVGIIQSDLDLRPTGYFPPVFDQLALSSCTTNALSSNFFYVDKKQGGISFLPSRLFIYYNERVAEGTVTQDCGAQIRTGIKCIVQQGACVEALWPYNPDLFAVAPPDICYIDAQYHQATVYRSVLQTETDIKSCLNEGYPIACGISVYTSFESDDVARTGMVPYPTVHDSLIGGHAVSIVGYTKKYYILLNSWGSKWGQGGYFFLPYDYVHNPKLASSFWMVHTVEQAIAA